MSLEFATRLQRYAGVIVHVGLNLRVGQRVLLAEPFELQGVSREAAPLVDAVRQAALAAGAANVDVIWGDETRWRAAAQRGGDRDFAATLVRNAERMRAHARSGGALVFLQASHPDLMADIPTPHIARLRETAWSAYAHVAPDLIEGRTNWTTAPAPTASWARAIGGGVPSEIADARLWDAVFAACRVDEADPRVAWATHLARLEQQRLELNQRRPVALHFRGDGTDLRVGTAPAHRWCTARLQTPDGRPFVANLPTEEIFTAPDRNSAEGIVRLARPVAYGGGVVAGVELEFHRGRVVRARAQAGEDLLRRILRTDSGADRLGEIALVPDPRPALTSSRQCFHHPLLDENAFDHIALGEAYPFTVGAAGVGALNHSLLHLDLPVAARVEVIDGERR